MNWFSCSTFPERRTSNTLERLFVDDFATVTENSYIHPLSSLLKLLSGFSMWVRVDMMWEIYIQQEFESMNENQLLFNFKQAERSFQCSEYGPVDKSTKRNGISSSLYHIPIFNGYIVIDSIHNSVPPYRSKPSVSQSSCICIIYLQHRLAHTRLFSLNSDLYSLPTMCSITK